MSVSSFRICLIIMTGCVIGQDEEFISGKDSFNVKTVLFRDSDSCKPCWAVDDIQLLVARKLTQDLIPTKPPTDFKVLAKYIKTCLDIVKTKSPPQSASKIVLASHDALGGYLKTVAIPILNEAYYAGNVPYETAAEIHGLYGKIMAFLKTDGGGWSRPIDMRKIPTKVRALTINLCNLTEACNTLEMRTAQTAESKGDDREPSKISIPYLDDNSYPNAIAIPLRGNSLFSLMSNCSAYILPKYYILSMRCLSSNFFTKKDLVNFNHQFYDWIISSVVPHVHETERWYPGFGGVMRIVETMNQRSLTSRDVVQPDTSPSENNLPAMDDVENISTPAPKTKVGRYMVVVLLVSLFMIFFCCCICYCVLRQCFKSPPQAVPVQEDSEGFTKTIVSLYCGVKDTIVGNKSTPRPEKEEFKSSSKSVVSDSCRGPFSSSSDDGDSTAPSSRD